jgi:hypothetical protein
VHPALPGVGGQGGRTALRNAPPWGPRDRGRGWDPKRPRRARTGPKRPKGCRWDPRGPPTRFSSQQRSRYARAEQSWIPAGDNDDSETVDAPFGAPRHKKLTLRRPAEGRCGIRTAGLTWNTLSRGEVFQAIRMSTTQFGRASSGQTPRIRLIRRNIRVCISEQGNAMNDRWLIMMAVLLVIAVAAWAAVVFLALH